MSRSRPTERERPDPDELEALAEDIRAQTEAFDDICDRLKRTAEHLREVHPDE